MTGAHIEEQEYQANSGVRNMRPQNRGDVRTSGIMLCALGSRKAGHRESLRFASSRLTALPAPAVARIGCYTCTRSGVVQLTTQLREPAFETPPQQLHHNPSCRLPPQSTRYTRSPRRPCVYSENTASDPASSEVQRATCTE